MMNLNKEGTPFARIIGGKYNNTLITMSDSKGFKQLKISNDAKLQLIPNPKTEREILYITGPSGSGKSTFSRKYLEQYKKTFKDNEVYLFSSLPDDESLDELELKRVRLDASIYEDPIPIKDFTNAAVIFDDIDVIADKRIREGVYSLLSQILEIGRHLKIKYVLTEYIGLDKKHIAKFKKMNSRWICIIKNFPGAYLSEREVGLLHPEENDNEKDKTP